MDNKRVILQYFDISEHTYKSINDLDAIGYTLMEESGYLMDRRIINNIDSVIIRTETQLENINTDNKESTFLVVPVVCIHKLLECTKTKEIDMCGVL